VETTSLQPNKLQIKLIQIKADAGTVHENVQAQHQFYWYREEGEGN
jgi:hypothetical protein